MSRNVIFNTLVVLAVTAQAQSQYVDFFQSFSSFLQPYQTTRRPDVVTRRARVKDTSKPRHQDPAAIFFVDDFDNHSQNDRSVELSTTVKPRRKTKTTVKPTTRFQNQNNNDRTTNNAYQNNNNDGDRNNRRVDNANNNVFNYNYVNNAKKFDTVTEQPVYNNNVNNWQKPRYTTKNPLLNRPGVRPAVVDENRPPITNRPIITSRPNHRPVTEQPKQPLLFPDDEPAVEIGPDEDAMSEAERRRYIEIAEQKCDEYKAMTTKKIVALPLATIQASHGVELNVSTCAPVNIPLIIGGKVVSIQEFPHMSLVGWKNILKGGYAWKCGGSLVSERFIVTAGHCTYFDKDNNIVSGPPSAVQLGSSYIDGRDAHIVSIASVVRHPKYKLRRSYYDVALIKLSTTITFSQSIMPACLGVPPPVDSTIVATGWGKTEFGGDSSQDLRSVSLPIWDMAECREVWGTSLKLPEGPSLASQLCAGERSGGKDTCQGDSGGPAQIQDGCAWRVVAITSVGRSCGAKDTPALYAKIPRAFIAAQIFANVKLNNNNRNIGNNNQDQDLNNNRNNGNNNWNQNSNQNFGNTRDEAVINSNDNNQFGIRKPVVSVPPNSRGVTNNKRGTEGVNVFVTNQAFGNNRETSRPGNHQTIDTNNRDGAANRNFFVTSHTSVNNRDTISRPGNHQTIDKSNKDTENLNYFVTSHTSGNNRDSDFSRPGNHQTIDKNNRDTENLNYFVTSHTSGNNRDTDVSRPGNHQTIDKNDRDTDNLNYFVTSHTSGNNRDTISRPGNHQTIDKSNQGAENLNFFVTSHTTRNNRDDISRPGNHQTIDKSDRDTENLNYFVTSQTSGSNRGVIRRPGNHQTIDNNDRTIRNDNRFGDNQNSESNQDNVYDTPGHYQNQPSVNAYNNEERMINTNANWSTRRPANNGFNNRENNSNTKSIETYSNYGSHNSEYGTTDNGSHNRNNNGYNENNNSDFVASRPWWNK